MIRDVRVSAIGKYKAGRWVYYGAMNLADVEVIEPIILARTGWQAALIYRVHTMKYRRSI